MRLALSWLWKEAPGLLAWPASLTAKTFGITGARLKAAVSVRNLHEVDNINLIMVLQPGQLALMAHEHATLQVDYGTDVVSSPNPLGQEGLRAAVPARARMSSANEGVVAGCSSRSRK